MRLVIIILSVALLSGVIIFLSAPAFREFRRTKAIDREISSLQSEANKIDTKNNLLKEKIAYLKSGDYKERVAKDRLNLRNPGEKIIVVQPKMSGNDKQSDNSEEAKSKMISDDGVKKLSNFQKWYMFLFGKK